MKKLEAMLKTVNEGGIDINGMKDNIDWKALEKIASNTLGEKVTFKVTVKKSAFREYFELISNEDFSNKVGILNGILKNVRVSTFNSEYSELNNSYFLTLVISYEGNSQNFIRASWSFDKKEWNFRKEY